MLRYTYTEQDLQRYEHLVYEARERVLRQQAIAQQVGSIEAYSVLDNMMSTLMLYERERLRILEELSK